MPAPSMEELARTQQTSTAPRAAQEGEAARQEQAQSGSNQAMIEELEAAKKDGPEAALAAAPTLEQLQALSPNSVGGFVARVVEYTNSETPLEELLVDSDHSRAITRGETAEVIYAALDLGATFEGTPEKFKDVPISEACAIPLYRCRQEGIFEGRGQEHFMPDELLRAEHVLPLLQLIGTWTDTTGADTSILGEGDLFDEEPLFTADAMGLGAASLGEDFPLDTGAIQKGKLDGAALEAILPEDRGGGRALEVLGKMNPTYPYIDDEGTVSELASQVLALAGRQTGSVRGVVKAVMSRIGEDPQLIRQDVDEKQFLKMVKESVLGWVDPGQRMLVEMQYKALFDKYAGIKRRYAVGSGSQQGLEGQVVDENGRPVAGQSVRVRDAAGRDFRTRTDAMGQFQLLVGLRPGEYTVWTANGERQSVSVQPSQVAGVELHTQKAAAGA